MPQNMADAVSTAVQASSLLSQQTALAMIPGIDDPQAEIKRKQEEQNETVKNAFNSVPNTPDYLVGDSHDDTEESEEQ